MKNNKISHLYTYVFLLVLSFFLFSSNVNADTYDISISQTDINYINNFNWTDRINMYNNYSSQNNFPYYFVTMVGTDGTINEHYIYYFSSIPTFEYRWEQVGWFTPIVRGTYTRCKVYFDNSYTCDNPSSSTLYLGFRWDNNETSFRTHFRDKEFLYTNFDIPYTLNNKTININNGNYVYTFDINNNFIGLYNLITYAPSIPPDNTPILTDFYTLIIDKFSVVADFFTDNTYLFAIPLIPIFVLCIYFIKRSLIK